MAVGPGAAYRPPALSPAAAHRRPIGGSRCIRSHPRSYGVHVELYARRLVVRVPAGIGIAPPQQRRGAYVLGGPCSYPLRTLEPTGVIVADQGPVRTLGEFFDVWGPRLGRGSLAGFRGRVLAFVGGRPVAGSPREIRLRRHLEIVLEIGGYVPPHPVYRFPPGL